MKNNNGWTRCPCCNVVETQPQSCPWRLIARTNNPEWKLYVTISGDGTTMKLDREAFFTPDVPEKDKQAIVKLAARILADRIVGEANCVKNREAAAIEVKYRTGMTVVFLKQW